jgi:tetratricopeptide (TPR) repeat protein
MLAPIIASVALGCSANAVDTPRRSPSTMAAEPIAAGGAAQDQGDAGPGAGAKVAGAGPAAGAAPAKARARGSQHELLLEHHRAEACGSSVGSPAAELASAKLAAEDESFVDRQGGKGWGDRCFAHLRESRLEEAHAACTRGLEQARGNALKGAILYNLGRIAEAVGDPTRAAEHYRRSLAIRPGNATVVEALRVLDVPCKLTITRTGPRRDTHAGWRAIWEALVDEETRSLYELEVPATDDDARQDLCRWECGDEPPWIATVPYDNDQYHLVVPAPDGTLRIVGELGSSYLDARCPGGAMVYVCERDPGLVAVLTLTTSLDWEESEGMYSSSAGCVYDSISRAFWLVGASGEAVVVEARSWRMTASEDLPHLTLTIARRGDAFVIEGCGRREVVELVR